MALWEYAIPGYNIYAGARDIYAAGEQAWDWANPEAPTAEELGMGFLQQGASELAGWRTESLGDIYGQRDQLRGPAQLSAEGFQPYAQAGQEGLGYISRGMGGYEDVLADPTMTPGGQFAMERGIMGAERGAAAGGTQLSGGQLQELQKIGTGYAQQDIQQQLGNYMQMAQFGQGMAGMGMGAQQAMTGVQQQNIANQQFMQNLGLGYTQLGAQTGMGYGGDIATMYGGMAGLQSQAAMLPYLQQTGMVSDLLGLGGQLGAAKIKGGS